MFKKARVAQARAKAQRDKNRHSLFRFRLNNNEKAKVIVLDAKITCAVNEHDLPLGKSQWGRKEVCVAEMKGRTCYICEGGHKPTFRAFLTVLDLRGYTNETTGKTIKQVRRRLPIGLRDLDEWKKLQASIIKKHGSMRGTLLLLSRGDDEKSAAIGRPSVMGDRLYKMVPEAKLIELYGNPAKRDKKTKEIIRPENEDLQVCDYKLAFRAPNEEETEALKIEFVGDEDARKSKRKRIAGSDEDLEDSDEDEDDGFDDEDEDEDEEDEDSDGDEFDDEDDEDSEEEDEEDDEDSDESDESDEEDEDDADDSDEDEEEDEEEEDEEEDEEDSDADSDEDEDEDDEEEEEDEEEEKPRRPAKKSAKKPVKKVTKKIVKKPLPKKSKRSAFDD